MKWAGSRTQALQRLRRVRHGARGDRLAAHEVREVGAVAAVRRPCRGPCGSSGRPSSRRRAGPRDASAAATAASGAVRWDATQRSKSSARVDVDAQQHLRVLGPAELGALSQVQARPRGSIHILFTRFGMRSVFPASRGTQKLWATSAERSVRKVGAGCAASLTGHVELVGGHDAELRIAKLPPPLAADDRDLEGPGRLRPVLDLEDRAGRRQPEDDDDEDRDDRPRDLDLSLP